MKSMMLKSVLLIILYFLIISFTTVNSSVPIQASESQQNLNMPISDGYNSSYNNSSISFVGQNNIVQAPTTVSVGRGYYSIHPISYGSIIGSKTLIKNERSPTSMQQDINYAHGINSQMKLAATDSSRSLDGTKFVGSATTHLEIDENVTDGRIHIGVLQGSDDSSSSTGADGTTNSGKDSVVEAWKKPAMEIDEDYIGTYHIYKNMTMQTSYSQNKRDDSWLDSLVWDYLDNLDKNWPHPASIIKDSIFNCKVADPRKTLKARPN